MTDTLKWDRRFLDLSNHIADWSKDPSTQVGAVITDGHNKVISIGYNGFPPNEPDDYRLYNREEKYKIIIHAEKNAIDFAKRDLSGYTIYTTPFIPCLICAERISKAAINRVVSLESSIDRWKVEFDKTRRHFKRNNIDLIEYPVEFIRTKN